MYTDPINGDVLGMTFDSLIPSETVELRPALVARLFSWFLPGSGGGGVKITSVPASLVPYTLSLSARLSSPRSVSKVESSCSLEPLQFLNAEQTEATVGCTSTKASHPAPATTSLSTDGV